MFEGLKTANPVSAAAVFTFMPLMSAGFGYLLLRQVTTRRMALPPIIWITIGYLTLFSTSASFFMLQYATLRLPSAKVMAYSYLTPAWVILWEIGFGSLLPPAHVLLGISATIVALLMLLRNDAQERPRVGGTRG